MSSDNEKLASLSTRIEALDLMLKVTDPLHQTERRLELRQEISKLGVRRYYLTRQDVPAGPTPVR